MTDYVLANPRRTDRLFYLGTAVALSVSVFIGFAPTYYLHRYYDTPVLTPLLHVHGFLNSLWLALFIAQTVLIAARQVAVHRRLGVFSVALAAAMVIVGTITTIQRAPLSPDALFIYASGFGDLVMFAVFVGAAMYTRRRAELHKRFMVLATVAIIDAGVGRWSILTPLFTDSKRAYIVATYAITDLFVVAGIVYDFVTRRRLHPVYLWGGIALVISQVVRFVIIVGVAF